MWIVFLFLLAMSEEPSYQKEISEKNKVSHETREQDQKTFFQTINGKSQEVLKYIRTTKDDLIKQQEVIRKDFEKKLKTEIEEVKKVDPQANVEPLRKAANEKRRALFEQLNSEKKTLETRLQEFKKQFDSFVKVQKENFQQQVKIISAKINGKKGPPAATPELQEFREIPPGPGTPLKPE